MDQIKTIVFFQNKMVMGGAESLILRLTKWYSTHYYNIILLTIDPVADDTILHDVNPNILYYYDPKSKEFVSQCNRKLLCFNRDEKILVFTEQIYSFIQIMQLLSKKYRNYQIYYKLYVVHPYGILVGRKIAWLMKPLIKRLVDEQIIVFMDEETRDTYKSYYRLNCKGEILRLPLFINEEIFSKPKNKVVNILTICRFDFPFKGYVLGLINSCEKIFIKNHEFRLTIIGYGNGLDRINSKIESLPSELQNRINIIDKLPYSEIDTYIDICDIFVGMGTTMLDAANRNKISIIPVAYQESDYAIGYFHDHYNPKFIFDKSQVNSYNHFHDLIIDIISYEDNVFIRKEDLSKEVLKEHYDINKIAPQFITHLSKLSVKDRIIINVSIIITKIANIIIDRYLIKHYIYYTNKM